MSRERLAAAYDNLADAYAQVAHELRGNEQPVREPAGVAEGGAPPSAPAAPHADDTSVCPKHGTAFTPSKNPGWASYCSQLTDDPAWGKPKADRDGNPVLYCRITNRNAGEWLAVHGRAAK